mgnify:CR=1 FL=1
MLVPDGALCASASVVGRVRQLLDDFDRATSFPGDAEARARMVLAERRGTASRDLAEVEDRLRRLREAFPEIEGVEIGRRVGEVRDFLGDRTARRPALASAEPAAEERECAE